MATGTELSTKEVLPKQQDIGVYHETDPLKKVALWGGLGPETVLTQLFPETDSLFYETFDVQAARGEYRRMTDFLTSNNVETVLVQDLLANLLTPEKVNSSAKNNGKIPHTLGELVDDLQNKGLALYRQYGVGNKASLDLIPELVKDDARRIGDEKAILLNWTLSLRHQLPSGNIFYGRDQSNVLGDVMMFSSMRWPIRKPEVGLWKMALETLTNGNSVAQPHGRNNVYLEGGDGIMIDGNVFLGVGGRTNFPGAVETFRAVEKYLSENGKEMLLVVNNEQERATYHQRHPKDEQKAMHLDTFAMPFGTGNKIICSVEDALTRHMYKIHRGGDNNRIMISPQEVNFLDYMEKAGIDICPIPKEEQLRYATNFLNLNETTVMVPFSDNTETMAHFIRYGMTVLPIEIYALSGGYGAIHCMTAALKRLKRGVN